MGRPRPATPTPTRRRLASWCMMVLHHDERLGNMMTPVEVAAHQVESAQSTLRWAVRAAHKKGSPVTELANQAGVTRQTIYRWIATT